MEKYNINRDYYDTLRIRQDATEQEIKEAFYIVGAKVMPKKHPIEEASIWEAKLNEVIEAYNVLKDPEARLAYDNARAEVFEEPIPVKIEEEEKPVERIKVTEVEESEKAEVESKKAKKKLNKTTIALLIACIVLGAGFIYTLNKDGKTVKVEPNEESLDNDVDVDVEIDVDKEVEVATATYKDTEAPAFYDAFDDEQVNTRAKAIQNFLQKSNVNNASVEDIEKAVKFINGSLTTSTEEQAYAELDNLFGIFESYSRTTAQAANYAGGIVDENGVKVALGFDAFLVDDTEHKEFMDEAAILFQNVLTADTNEAKVTSSKEFLNQQSKLMLGLLEDSTGTKMDYSALEEKEGFVYGLMSQFAAPVIKAALGEKYCLTYTDNLGMNVDVNIDTIFAHYNPVDCDGLYNNDNLWNLDTRELVKNCLLDKELTNSGKSLN